MCQFFHRELPHHPRGINPTRIRQILATAAREQRISETEEIALSHAMLHSIDVHRKYYIKESTASAFKQGRDVLVKLTTTARAEKQGKQLLSCVEI
jgi:hypothetical protein